MLHLLATILVAKSTTRGVTYYATIIRIIYTLTPKFHNLEFAMQSTYAYEISKDFHCKHSSQNPNHVNTTYQ